MKNLRGLYLHNSIFRFMISYTGVLLIPLLVCLLSYQFTFHTVKEEITQNSLSMLTNSTSLIDEQIQTINSLMIQTADNSQIKSFADRPVINNGYRFYSEALDVIDEFSYIFRYSNTDILSDFYLYIDKTDYIVTKSELYNTKLYHQMVLKESTNYKDWKAQLMEAGILKQYLSVDDKIRIIQALPIGINKPKKGAVVCDVDKQRVREYFTYVNIEDGANLYIEDKDGKILFQLDETQEIPEIPESDDEFFVQKVNGVESLVFKLTNNSSGWVYTLVLPEYVMMSKMTPLKVVSAIIFCAAVTIGLLVSYYMAKKSGQPIEEIKKQLIDIDDQELNVEEIASTSSLSGTLSKIMVQKQMLSEEIEKQKPYLESVLFQKLIKGEFIIASELQYICQKTGIKLDAEAYWVINCRFFGNNDMFNIDEQTIEDVNLLKILLEETVEKVILQKKYFYDLDQLTTTIILPKADITYDYIKESISKINEYMQKEYGVVPHWGTSSKCRDLLQLWRTFEEAKSAMKNGIEEGSKKLIEYSEMQIDQTTYYYPQVVEKQLLTHTKDSNIENIRQLLTMVYEENFKNRTLKEDTIDKLYIEIKGTIFKLIKHAETEFKIDKLEEYMASKNQEDIKKCFDEIINIYTETCKFYKQEKKVQQSKLIHRIMNYINENYPDPNLGLGMIASNFNISEGYVSSLFKDQAGINFTEYVETQRINKACELLKTTEININDISEKVGYNSVQSFRRAFKRMHGFSPSELRKNRE